MEPASQAHEYWLQCEQQLSKRHMYTIACLMPRWPCTHLLGCAECTAVMQHIIDSFQHLSRCV